MILYLYAMTLFCKVGWIFGSIIELSVKENTHVGTVIGNIHSDIVPYKSKSKLEIIKNDYSGETYFTLVKDNGDIIVRSLIDRETICENIKDDNCFIELLLDRDFDILRIRIKIEDVNDNSPLFPSTQMVLNIQENIPIGTTSFLPVAQDKDTTKNGVKNYSISNFKTIDNSNRESYSSKDKYFRIEGSVTPQLQVIGKIDREEITSFVFLLVASDSGSRMGSCTVTVIVTDVNDNSPEWHKDNYKVKIKECQDRSEILDFDATDKDDPNTSNGRLSFRFSERTKDKDKISQIFYINGNKLYLSNNRQTELSSTGFLMLYIIATDGNGRMKETSVEVNIEDCNDHSPIISINKRYGHLSENVQEKVSLSTVTVKDYDRGRNGEFDCTLNDSSILTLEKKHIDMGQNLIIYKIETNGDYIFDRERTPVYTVEIRCVDRGYPQMSSSSLFSINILDQNDNPPKFNDRSTTFYVMENNAIGSTVGQVKASDPDNGINGSVRYSMVESNNYFTVSAFGEIQSNIKFDREVVNNYKFTLLAIDGGYPPLNDTMLVKVIISDVNDCVPVFSKDYIFRVQESFGESLFGNERIGEIKATDSDLGINGSVTYKLMSVTFRETNRSTMSQKQLLRQFRISSDGSISISGNLDREKVSSILLTVEAIDGGIPRLSTQTTVIIEVLDVNDNTPMFTFPNKIKKSINISMESEIGAHVGTVSAEDPDQGVNGSIIFLTNEDSWKNFNAFKIEQDGKISVSSNLKTSKTNLPLWLKIQVTDSGSPPRTSIATLQLHYYVPSDDTSYQNSGRRSTDLPNNNLFWKQNNKNKNDNVNNQNNYSVSEYMTLLYCVAAILFFVFIIVFTVLVYIYCVKTYSNSENFLMKRQKSEISNMSSNLNMKEIQHMPMIENDFPPGKNGESSSVCFINEDGSNYTHLMMLNNNKYTAMKHMQGSPNSFLRQNQSSEAEIMFSSNNPLDSMINSSTYPNISPQMYKRSTHVLSFCNSNNRTLLNCSQNYSTLQDKQNFNSLNRSAQTMSLVDKHYSLEGSNHCQKQKDVKSPYVTSSFV